MNETGGLARAQLERLIKGLEHFRTRPQMYLRDVESERCQMFFHGILFGLSAICAGLGHDHLDLKDAAARARGWTSIYDGLGFDDQMRERGWTNEQIVDELIVIEAEAWRLAAAALP